MSHTYHKVWIHLIWTTKERFPYLNKEIKNDVIFHIKEKGGNEGIHVDTINGVAEYIHCLIELDVKQNISNVANQLKGESSHWINQQKLTKSHFAWQEGYSAFSIGESQVTKVREYIRHQEEHHQKMSFQEEMNRFLKAYNLNS
ncbi:MAG: IS200/IS605 family transposase [Candidatus Edwardsbacteria bacterium]